MASLADLKKNLDTMAPAAAHAQLGTTLVNLINAFNVLEAKYIALLAHLDAADVAGIGNANSATFGAAAGVAPALNLGSTPTPYS